MDSESLAAAGVLEALSRASAMLAELRHPFARSCPFSYFLPPAGARTGTTFVLPDGREVRFEVSVAVSGGFFHVNGSVAAEDDVLLDLPRVSVPGVREALAALDDYAAEVAAPAGRVIDRLLEELG
ncbi:hypothetical protein AB0L05_02465 [Nonomuraea pusilla]|uniref:hypothetical protein n=1 Tax=Nonomuraea pusilla TaxID=46177 RepID=UPI0033262782